VKIIDFPQGSEEWRLSRAGKVTASCMDKVIAKIKTGEAAARRDYRCQIVAEILTGQPQDSTFMNDEMRWGIEHEPFGAATYEVRTNTFTEKVGLVVHPLIERAAASPDRLVSTDGLLEVKCPKTATHLKYLLDGAVPSDYEPQMQWQMACCERAYCDFVSYDPRLPEKMRFFVKRLPRNEPRIKELELEVIAFLVDVDRMIETLKRFA